MSATVKILLKTLVKTFFRQNSGFFIFLIIVMFGAVGQLDNHDMVDYHYSLIVGMLSNPLFFILVLFGWFLYGQKCMQFVVKTLHKTDFHFLYILSQLDPKKVFLRFFVVQLLLFLPVVLYSAIIVGVAIYNNWYFSAAIVLLYNVLLCVLISLRYLYELQHPGRVSRAMPGSKFAVVSFKKGYWIIFIRYLLNSRKLLLCGVKLYDCMILYLFFRNLTPVDHEISLGFIFFSFGLLGHGVIIHQLREFEEAKLLFYRSLPIPLLKRFGQYALLYAVLLVPEVLVIAVLVPNHLYVADAVIIIFSSYAILLLLNSLLFVAAYAMKDYLKIVLVVFCLIWFATFTATLLWFAMLFLAFAIIMFVNRYYFFEKNDGADLTFSK